MKNVCYLIVIACAVFLIVSAVFGCQDECKSYCDDAFKSVSEQQQTVYEKASEIGRTCAMLESQGVEGAMKINEKLSATCSEYQDAQKTLGAACFLYDLADAFKDAGVDVPGFTHENAARVVTSASSKFDALEQKLDALAEELRKIIEPDQDASYHHRNRVKRFFARVS
jgi:hypothetical protein